MAPSFTDRKCRSLKQGFSIVEVVIATFLVTFVGAGVVSGVITSQRLNYINAQRVAAFGLAKAKIEELHGVGYEELTERYGSIQQEIDLELVNLGGVNQVMIPARRTTFLSDLTDPERKQVTVTVEWDFQGREIQENIETLLYPRR